MKKLAILGGSGHGKVVADTALAAGWDDIVFFDDRWPRMQSVGEWPVVGDTGRLLGTLAEVDGVIVGVGDCQVRAEKHALLRGARAPCPIIAHPNAWVSPRCHVGVGSVIVAGAIINVHATLGEACIVNSGATVDHDCILGIAVHVSPGANLSGEVEIGDRSWIGVGACVRQGIRIGSGVTVGAGSVVVANVRDGATVVGSPARPMRVPGASSRDA
jgi:sugar O-acyltransferase (sialic acid O-acetyltransferase NeuD family)